jgi:hypothetical protein
MFFAYSPSLFSISAMMVFRKDSASMSQSVRTFIIVCIQSHIEGIVTVKGEALCNASFAKATDFLDEIALVSKITDTRR